MGELNVSFQIDTDNRENFPSAIAFQTFRQQRDTFYEVLRIWEENHLVPGWTFQIALGGKIRTLLTLHNDAVNYYHFARLFKSQLLTSCIQNGQQVDVMDDESMSFLKTLKHVNPEKLTQLQKRLVTPLPSKTSVARPGFPGVQEFFKDFILFAFNPIFYAHLENCLVHEILELNDTQFAGSEIEETETSVDDQTQQNFITCLSSLQLLAKVLGLLVSLPYRSEANTSKEITATQVEARSRVLPSLNLHGCLQNAITLGKLSLTIPWMAKYLAMMDSVSLRLPYYKQLLELLYYIYKAISYSDVVAADSPLSQRTVILLRSTLGWLFELPNLPKDFYPSWQRTCKLRELRSLKQLTNEKQWALRNLLVGESTVIPAASESKFSLDKLEILNEKALKSCCPSSTLNRVSASAASSSPSAWNTTLNNYNGNKHITPVSSQLQRTAGTAGTKQLELQLEQAFFHGQPTSTRRTVEFVAERVASACVKHICNTLLASSRESSLNTFRKILKKKQEERQTERQGKEGQTDQGNGPGTNSDGPTDNGNTEEASAKEASQFRASATSEVNALAVAASKELKDQCEVKIPSICEARVSKSIEALLPEDCQLSVKEVCVKIATRLATERIHQWIQSHIVGGSLFVKDMELEMNRFLRNSSPLHTVREKNHNPNAISPTSLINHLRALLWDMLDNEENQLLNAESAAKVLDDLYETLNERTDLLVGPEKVLYSLSIDFALFLVTHRTDLFTPKIEEKLLKIWSMSDWKCLEPDPPMHRILSPRNVMLLAQPQKNEVWPVFGRFIKKLVDRNVLDVEVLSDQCVALFRQEWPVPILKHLSKCLTEAIAEFKAADEATEKVKYLLGWIAETYHQIEFYDDYNPTD